MPSIRRTKVLVGNPLSAKTNPGTEVEIEYMTFDGKMFIAAESVVNLCATGGHIKLGTELVKVKQQAESKARQEAEAASA